MAIDRTGRVIYVPDPRVTTTTPEALPRVMFDELYRISHILRALQQGRLEPIFEAPDKPREGDVRMALAPLDLGSGDGVYAYRGGSWRFLG